MISKAGTSNNVKSSELPSLIDKALVDFELDNIHCCIVAENQDAQDYLRVSKVRVLNRFQIGQQRYMLCAPDMAKNKDTPADPLSSLTPREQQIVRLVCLGCVNKQIADKLKISEYTVKTYLKQIFFKLDVHSRSAMAYRCAEWVRS